MKINLTNRMAAKIISRALRYIAGKRDEGHCIISYERCSYYIITHNRAILYTQKEFENVLVYWLEK